MKSSSALNSRLPVSILLVVLSTLVVGCADQSDRAALNAKDSISNVVFYVEPRIPNLCYVTAYGRIVDTIPCSAIPPELQKH